MLTKATCNTCGADLGLGPGVLAVRCEHCGSVYHVQESPAGRDSRQSAASAVHVHLHGSVPSPEFAQHTRRSPDVVAQATQPSPPPTPPPDPDLRRYEALLTDFERVTAKDTSLWSLSAIIVLLVGSFLPTTLEFGWALFAAAACAAWLLDRPRRRNDNRRAELRAQITALSCVLGIRPPWDST